MAPRLYGVAAATAMMATICFAERLITAVGWTQGSGVHVGELFCTPGRVHAREVGTRASR